MRNGFAFRKGLDPYPSLDQEILLSFNLKVLSNEKKGGSCLVSFDRYCFNLQFRNIFSMF